MRWRPAAPRAGGPRSAIPLLVGHPEAGHRAGPGVADLLVVLLALDLLHALLGRLEGRLRPVDVDVLGPLAEGGEDGWQRLDKLIDRAIPAGLQVIRVEIEGDAQSFGCLIAVPNAMSEVDRTSCLNLIAGPSPMSGAAETHIVLERLGRLNGVMRRRSRNYLA